MNRLEEVRKVVDKILMEQLDLEERRCGYVHLYYLSNILRGKDYGKYDE